jgi:short-subunit dehydrogenase
MPFGKLVEQDNAIIHKQMAINYGGLVNITQAVLPGMLERGHGDFVSFASMAGIIPMLLTGAYTATKFAVRAFTETLYHENLNSGIRFACVCPPAVATPLLQQGRDSAWPKMLEEQSEPIAPKVVIDAIENCLKKGKFFVYPTRDAKIGAIMRRLLPGLIWKQIHQVEGFESESDGSFTIDCARICLLEINDRRYEKNYCSVAVSHSGRWLFFSGIQPFENFLILNSPT